MEERTTNILTLDELDSKEFRPEFYKEMDFGEYFRFAVQNPHVAYSAYQRMYQSIVSRGWSKYTFAQREYLHYPFFDDVFGTGEDAIFGLDKQMMRLVETLRAGAARLGQEKRIILLHGPVGSSKSTIARLLRGGLQNFSKTDAGQLYTYSWLAENDEDKEILGITLANTHEARCPVHEDPFKLLPADTLQQVATALNRAPAVDSKTGEPRERSSEQIIKFTGDPCPFCRQAYREFLRRYNGEWKTILQKHIRVRRLIFSEADRIGIGSFRPKDEKNQDSTELSGDLNYRKIAEFGSESDPRAFNFDGEFQVSERGYFYVEEIFKLDKAFLYDFLGATQEHKIKPKRFAEMSLDTVLMGGTNNPEYERLRDDETMEAFRDRTTRVDVPYVLKLDEEERIYGKVYTMSRGLKHIAPHTIQMASLWAILTRIKKPGRPNTQGISLRDKVRLYNGKKVANYTDEHVNDMMEEHPDDGMGASISPRYIQDKIGDAMVEQIDVPCVTWYAVKKELEEGLNYHSLLKGSQRIEEFKQMLAVVDEEFTEIVKSEVEEAIVADESDIETLFNKYLDNVTAYVNGEKIRDYRGEMVPPDEDLMRAIEEKIGKTPQAKDEYRARLVQSMGTFSRRGQIFNYKADEELYRGLRLKLFEDRKDIINLATLRTGVVDPEEQEKIEIVKKRMKDRFKCCNWCAKLYMEHVASILAAGTKRAQR